MSLSYYLSLCALAAMPIMALAQAPASAHAVDADAAVMPAEYKSVFDGYQVMEGDGDTPANLWRSANDEVGRIGGHAGYMRSVQDQAADASAAKGDASEWSPVAPHSGHGGHHGHHH